MPSAPIASPDDTTPSGLLIPLASWRRHLAAQRMSPRTLDTCSAPVRALDAFLAAEGPPRDVADIRGEHAEAFIPHLQAAVPVTWKGLVLTL